MPTWTRATGITPVDPDSEQGQQISRDLTVALLEVKAAQAERRRIAQIEATGSTRAA